MAAKNEEYARSLPLLNKIFAWSSIGVLVCTIWMVWDDYARPWKRIQRRFYELAAKKSEEELRSAREAVDEQQQKTILEQLRAAEAQAETRKKDHEELSARLASIDVKVYVLDRDTKNAKSVFDAVRFEYEELSHRNSSRAPEALRKLHQVQSELAELKGKLEQALAEQKKLQDEEKAFTGATAELEKKRQELLASVERAQKKLATVKPQTFVLRVFEYVRNAPLLDFLAPSLRIQQVVLNGQIRDINFITIPRVDRCQTCHLAADQAGYEDAAQPFTNHAKLDLFLSGKSPHPVERVGCTVCHRGLDRATEFLDAAHWPDSPEQEAAWKKTHDWHPKEHEESPMLPSRHIEASCQPCHRGVLHIPQAARWNQGRDLIERYGCFGCHKIKGFEGLRKAGPLLTRLAWKTSPEWAYGWVENPTAFRPSTRMPRFFGLSNNSSPEDLARSRQEIRGIVAYLFEKTEPGGFPPLPGRGDTRRGEALVTQVGCLGCHAVARLEKEEPTFRRRFGPDLDGIGSKVRPEWVYAWVRNPRKYFPETRMPNLRLTDQEALDITAYLMSLKVEGWKSEQAPSDPKLLDDLVAEQLHAKMTADEVKAQMSSLSTHEKETYLGQRMILRYGCFGCHLIPGFETTPPIGTELTEEGSKSVDRLDFGFVKIPETRHDWIYQKLENPRIFDEGKVKTAEEKLKMPLFPFTPEERGAVVTAVLSFTKEQPILSSTRLPGPRDRALEAGRRIVFDHNCQGCHELEGEGQEIVPTIARTLTAQGLGTEDAEVRAAAYSPPLITGEGFRVRPDWLFRFLKGPFPIRPWLQVRMPTFDFTDEETNTLLQYFSALSEAPFPFETMPVHVSPPVELAAGRTLVARDLFNCFSCHQQGAKKPEGTPDSWAPDLALARCRLRPDWIIEWIKNPQKLYPGTKMPTYYDPDSFDSSGPEEVLGGDEDRQIRVIRDYLLTLGGECAGS